MNKSAYNPFTPNFNSHLLVGRENELEALKISILDKKEKIIAITGGNATGKTTLWMSFINRAGIEIAKQTEVVSLHRSSDEFPKIKAETRLIVIEDLHYDFTPSLREKINSFIGKYAERQFLLISTFKDLVKQFYPSSHIHLESFHQADSVNFLQSALTNLLPGEELKRILKFAKGNPLLLNLIVHHIEKSHRNLDEIFNLLSSDIRYQSPGKGIGNSIIDVPRDFGQIFTDVRIINGRLLEYMQKDPNAMYSLTPRQFEEMVAELMSKRGYHVDLTKATRDGGKDLIIANHEDLGNFIYYVECKRFAPTNPVGVNIVRELAGTIHADRVTAGIVVTSSYFSPDAIDFSEKLKHQISLIDFIKLKDWINGGH